MQQPLSSEADEVDLPVDIMHDWGKTHNAGAGLQHNPYLSNPLVAAGRYINVHGIALEKCWIEYVDIIRP